MDYGQDYPDPYGDDRVKQLKAKLVDAEGLRAIPPPRPLVAGWLYLDSLAWLGGKPGSGKTFAAVDIAGSVGTGTDWHGQTVTQGPVLYIIAEAVSGLSQRVDAWETIHGHVAGITFLPVAVQLLDDTEMTAVTTVARDLAAVLVVIDTQARVTVGAEENSAKDMGEFVDALDRLREATRACILTVHHEPRNGEGLRGSIALEGAATTVIHAKKDGVIIELATTKQKDAPEQPPMKLALHSVGMSAVLSHEASGLSGYTTSSERKVLTVLRDSFGTRGATKTELREAADLPRTTWYTTINSLENKGLVLARTEGRSTIYTAPADSQQQTIPDVPNSPERAGNNSPESHHPFRGGTSGIPGTNTETDDPPPPETDDQLTGEDWAYWRRMTEEETA
jgi:AAA domain-containing protein/penicillinase repressor